MRLLPGVGILPLAAVAVTVLLPCNAGARTLSPTAGTVTLKISAAAQGRLDAVDVRVSGKRLRVASGSWSFDRLADDGGGTLKLKGTITFRRGRLKMRISDIQLSLSPNSGSGRFQNGRISARIGKSRFQLGSLITRRYHSSPGRFEGLDIVFSPAFGGAVNRALQARAMNAKDTFGGLVGRDITQNVTFTGGQIRVSLSDETRAAFARVGASVTPINGATGDGSRFNPFVLPITGRRLDLVSLRGAVTLGGGLRFTAPPGQTFGSAQGLDLAGGDIGFRDDAYLLRTPSLEFFSAFADADATLSQTGNRYRHTSLALQFTRPAADRLAPALGITPAELIQMPKGALDIDATAR